MVKEELIRRSPIRLFEQSIHGGLKAGEIGVVASPAGVGKTSVLVQLGLDKLLQGKKVIHVSFTQHAHYVIAWYEDIFSQFTSKKNLENEEEVKNDLVKNRVLMNFNQDGVSGEQILKSLRAMIVDGSFAAESVIIDGFDFSRADYQSIAAVRNFAKELGLSIWYSCTVGNGLKYDKGKIPLAFEGFADLVDVVIVLDPKQGHIELSVSKDRDSRDTRVLAMRLDPRTLLISEK